MENQEIVERLNENLHNEAYQRCIHQLQQNGARFSDIWNIINTVKDMDEFKRKTIYTVHHELMEQGLKLGDNLFKQREKKEMAIDEMNYTEAKNHFHEEYKLKIEILKHFRRGDLRKHCVVSDSVVDVLEPNLIDIKELQ